MVTFREFIKKRFLIEQGIGSPGAIPVGSPIGGSPGMPPMGGPPGGMGGPPGGMGPPGGGGGDLAGKKPLELKPLDVWSVLERLLGLEKEETKPPKLEPKQNKHLQS